MQQYPTNPNQPNYPEQPDYPGAAGYPRNDATDYPERFPYLHNSPVYGGAYNPASPAPTPATAPSGQPVYPPPPE